MTKLIPDTHRNIKAKIESVVYSDWVNSCLAPIEQITGLNRKQSLTSNLVQ